MHYWGNSPRWGWRQRGVCGETLPEIPELLPDLCSVITTPVCLILPVSIPIAILFEAACHESRLSCAVVPWIIRKACLLPLDDMISNELTSFTVSKHNTPESCWVILYNNVYDVSGLPLICWIGISERHCLRL